MLLLDPNSFQNQLKNLAYDFENLLEEIVNPLITITLGQSNHCDNIHQKLLW